MALVCAITVTGQSSGTVACDFGFEVVDLPCSALPAPVPQPDVIPSNSNWGLGLLALVVAGIGFMVVRARH
ncbi:MAG: IPTL-CTERM sorting domain-containing protein [Lysobacteraceae bacterium]